MSQPWFRFYSETLNDRKIEYLCRTTAQPKALVVGIWTTILALANDSPVRGVLLLTEDIPLTVEDLARETGLDIDALQSFLNHLLSLKMMARSNGVYHLTNWDKRQFASDNSTERVRKWRERQRETEGNGDCNNGDESGSNATETLRGGYGNGPEADSETETETDNLHASVPERPPPKAKAPGYTTGQRKFLELFGAKRFKLVVQADTVRDLECRFGTKKLLDVATWAAKRGMNVGSAIVSVESALNKQAKTDKPQVLKVGVS